MIRLKSIRQNIGIFNLYPDRGYGLVYDSVGRGKMTFPIQLGVKSEPNFREKRVVLSMAVSWDYYHYGSLVLSLHKKKKKWYPV